MAIKLIDPEMRRARAMAMVARRIHGASYRDIAAEFNVSIDTVERSLTYAKRAGLIVRYEDKILSELVPGAIDQVKKAITNGDTATAMEVLKGSGMLLKPSEKAKQEAPASEGETLEIYIKRFRGGDTQIAAAASNGSSPAAELSTGDDIIDAALNEAGIFEVPADGESSDAPVPAPEAE